MAKPLKASCFLSTTPTRTAQAHAATARASSRNLPPTTMARIIGRIAVTAHSIRKATCGGSRSGCATLLHARLEDCCGSAGPESAIECGVCRPLRPIAARNAAHAAAEAEARRRTGGLCRHEPAGLEPAPARVAQGWLGVRTGY